MTYSIRKNDKITTGNRKKSKKHLRIVSNSKIIRHDFNDNPFFTQRNPFSPEEHGGGWAGSLTKMNRDAAP